MTEPNTVEFNLLDAFRLILFKWRSLIIGASIGGCLLGAFMLVRNYRSMTDASEIASRREEHEVALEEYEISKEQLEAHISNLQSELELQQYIEDHNILLRIDPYNVYTESATYYVDTGYEVQPELSYQNPDRTSAVTNSYRTVLQRIDLNEVLGTFLGEEVMTGNPVRGNSFTIANIWTESSNGALYITINGENRESVDAVMDAVEKAIAEASIEYQSVYGEHTITRFESSQYQRIDLDLAAMQTSFTDNLEKIRQSLLDSVKELSELKAPALEESGLRALAKKTIKYGLVGCVAGILVVMVWVVLRFATQDQLWNLREVRRRCGVRVLGTYPGKTRSIRTKLERQVAKKVGVTTWTEPKTASAYLKERIHMEIRENAIVLSGSEGMETLNELCTSLKEMDPDVSYTVVGNLNTSDQAVSTISKAKAVILVERWRNTSLRTLQEELEMVWTVVPKEKTSVIVII